jgi:hypothetical protein
VEGEDMEEAWDEELFVDTAKTESWGASRFPWHFGHSAF